jgi:voltage-gated potassium channel
MLEPQTVKGGFADGVWWAIVTASTVGYGDIAPTTVGGRLIAVMLMLSGVGLVSTLAASITAYFVGHEENVALIELNEKTTRIENLLRSLDERLPAKVEPEGAPAVGEVEFPARWPVKSATAENKKS